jgi:GNAT superfamily N-acetyltransferase
VQYRRATTDDINAMAQIRAAVWGDVDYWVNRISGYMNGTSHAQKSLMQRIVFVAVENEIIVGFIAGHLTTRFECDGELEWINIISLHQKKGIAFALLQLLAKWFIENNSIIICVNAEPSNTAAQHFYKQNGAKPVNEYWLVWDDISIVLSK